MRYRPRRGERGGFGGAEVVHKWQRRSLKSTCTANLERPVGKYFIWVASTTRAKTRWSWAAARSCDRDLQWCKLDWWMADASSHRIVIVSYNQLHINEKRCTYAPF